MNMVAVKVQAWKGDRVAAGASAPAEAESWGTRGVASSAGCTRAHLLHGSVAHAGSGKEDFARRRQHQLLGGVRAQAA